MSVLIPSEMRVGLHCFFCGTDKSVKYLKTIKDMRTKDKLVTVCCCNECIVRYSDESK